MESLERKLKVFKILPTNYRLSELIILFKLNGITGINGINITRSEIINNEYDLNKHHKIPIKNIPIKNIPIKNEHLVKYDELDINNKLKKFLNEKNIIKIVKEDEIYEIDSDIELDDKNQLDIDDEDENECGEQDKECHIKEDQKEPEKNFFIDKYESDVSDGEYSVYDENVDENEDFSS